jgi:ribosomal protein L23
MINKFKTTEKGVRIVEAENTLVVEVGLKDSKDQIKLEIEKMLNIKVVSVRTHIKDNKKIAYIRLDRKNPAIDVATKFGVI